MFRRPDERQHLSFLLDRGKHILMLAPRRVGKTWLAKQLVEDMRQRDWFSVYADVEGRTTTTDFLREICQRIEQESDLGAGAKRRAAQAVKQFLTKGFGGSWRDSLGQIDWSSFLETLVSGLDQQPSKTLIVVDEIALFAMDLIKAGPDAAKTFFYQLRSLQQRYPKVQWLFTGSIGLDTIARRAGIGGALVEMEAFPLDPFTPDAARAFLHHLCDTGAVMRPFALDDASFQTLQTELGWLSPYYLEHAAGQVKATGPAQPNGRRTATPDDIRAAIDTLLTDPYRQYFVTWDEHLTKNFPRPQATLLRTILGQCCASVDGERLDTLATTTKAKSRPELREALTVLVADGYLHEVADGDTSRFRFRSGLLRRYWRRYHLV